MVGVVAEEDVGELAATADLTGGVSALKMDQENAAPDAGKQHLPPEDQKPQNSPDSDPDRAAVRAEQPEEERTSGWARPPPQRRALRGPKHLFDDKSRVKPGVGQFRVPQLLRLAPILLWISLYCCLRH